MSTNRAQLESLLFLLTALAANAAPSLTLDLASPPPGANITRIHGHGVNNSGLAGVPVCGGFDCDGDSHRDFAFAQFQASPFGRTGAGEVTVIFGDGTIGGTKNSALTQAGMLIIAGDQPFETTGSEAWMDDLTGDGLGDLLIGRQNYTLPGSPSRPGAGALTVLVGNPSWKTHAATLTKLDLRTPPPTLQLITFVGPADYDRLGIWMRTGDITGDGIDDLAIGNPHDNPGSRANAGSVHVFYGQAGGWPVSIDLLPANLPGPGTMRIAFIQGALGSDGLSDGDTLCYSAAAGDINNDGRPDLLVNEMAGNGFGGTPQDVGNLLVIDAAALLAPFTPTLTPSAPGPLDFGTLPAPSGNSLRNITWTNNTGSTVNITSLSITGPAQADFTITADSAETSLPPAASRTLSITFDPATVGRSGAAISIKTTADPHPIALGLAGRAVNDSLTTPTPTLFLHLFDTDAVLEIPDSQFGTDYTLLRDPSLTAPTPLLTLPGTGQSLFFPDPDALGTFDAALYRITAERN